MNLECPNCGCHTGNKVTHTWTKDITWQGIKKTTTRRRRVCRHCGLSWNTVEHVEDEDQPGIPQLPPIHQQPDDPDEPFGSCDNPYL